MEQSLLAQLEEEREVMETLRHQVRANLHTRDILQTDNVRLNAELRKEKKATDALRLQFHASLRIAEQSLQGNGTTDKS